MRTNSRARRLFLVILLSLISCTVLSIVLLLKPE